MAAAMQTESQIISSFLIRDDRATSKTKRRERTYENKNDAEEKNEERGERRRETERDRERIIHLFIVVLREHSETR